MLSDADSGKLKNILNQNEEKNEKIGNLENSIEQLNAKVNS